MVSLHEGKANAALATVPKDSPGNCGHDRFWFKFYSEESQETQAIWALSAEEAIYTWLLMEMATGGPPFSLSSFSILKFQLKWADRSWMSLNGNFPLAIILSCSGHYQCQDSWQNQTMVTHIFFGLNSLFSWEISKSRAGWAWSNYSPGVLAPP